MKRHGEKRMNETNASRCTERRDMVTKIRDRETEVIVSEIYVSCSLPMFFRDVTRNPISMLLQDNKKSEMVVEQVH